MGELTPALLLSAYAQGLFPMADSKESDEIYWFAPEKRGIFPLEAFHISRSLARHIKQCGWRVSLNEAFEATLTACADRTETWINAEIAHNYKALHAAGFAHSLELWEGSELVGGVYGVTLGQAFFGESMFSTKTNGSKTALAYLCTHLKATGYRLFDTQFLTDHLASLGAVEISKSTYEKKLSQALQGQACLTAHPLPHWSEVLKQRKTQTS